MLKTHSCGQLRLEDVGQTVTLAGWVNRRRDMGGVIFIDLRDRLGKCQVVIDAGRTADGFKLAEQVRGEYVLQIKGTVSPRPAGQENLNLPTGDTEVLAEEVVILNPAKTPPFLIDRDENVDESLRLKYRYLDLRRERLQRRSLPAIPTPSVPPSGCSTARVRSARARSCRRSPSSSNGSSAVRIRSKRSARLAPRARR